jgi:hypothetical protein
MNRRIAVSQEMSWNVDSRVEGRGYRMCPESWRCATVDVYRSKDGVGVSDSYEYKYMHIRLDVYASSHSTVHTLTHSTIRATSTIPDDRSPRYTVYQPLCSSASTSGRPRPPSSRTL